MHSLDWVWLARSRVPAFLAAGQILVRLKGSSGLPTIKSLPRHHVVPYFSPDEKVEYRDPNTGQVSIATVHKANGEQWPPYYAIRIVEPKFKVIREDPAMP